MGRRTGERRPRQREQKQIVSRGLIAAIFVRRKGGVSDNPLESITLEDCALGLAAPT